MARANNGRRYASVKIWMSKASVNAAVARLGADQIAVVEDDGAGAFEAEHGADMANDGGAALFHKRVWIVPPHAPHFGEASARRNIAVNEIVRRSLIGDYVWDDAACEQRLVNVSRVAENADRRGAALALRRCDQRQSVVEIAGAVIEVAVGERFWRCALRRSRCTE